MRRLIAILLAAGAALFAACAAVNDPPVTGLPAAPAPGAAERPRLLFVALDAVPYRVVERVMDPAAGDEAAFGNFAGPAPLISTFPSTTSLALGGILEPFGLEKSAGYEHRFYDRAGNRKRGGGPISYNKLIFPWRKFFDWQLKGFIKKGLTVFHLQKSARRAIDESLAAFAASGEDVFHLYHDLTDLIGHIRSPDALEPFLRYLDSSLDEIRDRRDARPFYTVVYSDHGLAGGEPLRNVRRGVKKALRRDGRRIRSRIDRPEDVVFIPYGLVSSFVAFTAPGEEVPVAETVAGVEGVDLCVASEGEGWRVISRRGSARVLRRTAGGADLWAYLPLSGDPLTYAELIGGSPNAGTLDRDSSEGDEPDLDAADWHSDAWWFEATKTAPYPDALYRIGRGFELVENPASIICATAHGFLFGAAVTVFGSRISTGKLEWTHGAMASEPSLGFVISDVPGWEPPEAVRFDRALVPWSGGHDVIVTTR